MTRNEAIKRAGDTGAIRPGDFIDMCVDLGMLKLDEPKDNFQVLCRVLSDWRASDAGANAFMNRLESAGLKIVEK